MVVGDDVGMFEGAAVGKTVGNVVGARESQNTKPLPHSSVPGAKFEQILLCPIQVPPVPGAQSVHSS